MKWYLRQCSHLMLNKGLLYRQVMPSKEERNALQLVISQSYQKKALKGCHNDIRHDGVRVNVGSTKGLILLAQNDQGFETSHSEV